MEESKEKLIKIYNETKQREGKTLDKLSDESERPYQLGFLEGINRTYAIYDIYIAGDFKSARQHFYKCATVVEYMYKNYKQSIHTSTRNFCYAILSDNNTVVNRFRDFDDNYFSHFGACFGKAIQACLKKDYGHLAQLIKSLDELVNVESWEKYYSGSVAVFKGILNNNIEEVRQGLSAFLSMHSKQDHPALARDFVNIEATALVKLCWRLDLKVEISHPLVPEKMLPIQELSSYEGYDFLR